MRSGTDVRPFQPFRPFHPGLTLAHPLDDLEQNRQCDFIADRTNGTVQCVGIVGQPQVRGLIQHLAGIRLAAAPAPSCGRFGAHRGARIVRQCRKQRGERPPIEVAECAESREADGFSAPAIDGKAREAIDDAGAARAANVAPRHRDRGDGDVRIGIVDGVERGLEGAGIIDSLQRAQRGRTGRRRRSRADQPNQPGDCACADDGEAGDRRLARNRVRRRQVGYQRIDLAGR